MVLRPVRVGLAFASNLELRILRPKMLCSVQKALGIIGVKDEVTNARSGHGAYKYRFSGNFKCRNVSFVNLLEGR